jgi:protein-tyrosine-phosphatase/DNA-binding transcriptional ArsR family regulator
MARAKKNDVGAVDPPSFLSLAAHPLRWRLLQELVRSDQAVKELVELVDEPQNLVSYHLRLLREAGLVAARRSSADRRDSYYAIDLDACRAAHDAAGSALHPALSYRAGPMPASNSRRRPRVLFLCTGNSARSQIAEALTEHMSSGTVDAESAGSVPKPLHPHAIRVARRRGIDISARRSKHLEQFVGQRFDAVITLCDRVREVRPHFPFADDEIHWSLPDPSIPGSSGRATLAAFERTAAELETRIAFRLHQFHQLPNGSRRPVHA